MASTAFYIFVLIAVWFSFGYYTTTTLVGIMRHHRSTDDGKGRSDKGYVGSNGIRVYPMVDQQRPRGFVAVSNGVVLVNFDGKGYMRTPPGKCEKHGWADYVRLPPPSSVGGRTTRRRRERPERQCLPYAVDYLVRSAVREPLTRPALVPITHDTGNFAVNMTNALMAAGYFHIRK